jgi:hypothetical protein
VTPRPGALDPSTLVDLDRWPIHGPRRAEIVAVARSALADHGVAALEGFLRPEVVERMCLDARGLEAVAHHSEVVGTAYLALPDESFPPDHPRRAQVRSSLSAVAYDLFAPDAELRRLYEWDGLLDLLAEILDRGPLHRYADPLGALNLAVMGAGDELGWHFDQTDFVVSLALQASERGGDFESATRIRAEGDERYDDVAAVLAGARRGVTSIPMSPGTLLLFEGRHSMHRVTPIDGDTPRYVALLAYDTKPDTDSSELLKLVRYGRLP